MKVLTQIFVNMLLLSIASATMAQKPSNTIDLSVTFSELHANAPVGGCGCFWMVGGTGELSFPLWRNFSAVIAAGGQHTNYIPNFNTGLVEGPRSAPSGRNLPVSDESDDDRVACYSLAPPRPGQVLVQ
jgi:hypothetical protein